REAEDEEAEDELGEAPRQPARAELGHRPEVAELDHQQTVSPERGRPPPRAVPRHGAFRATGRALNRPRRRERTPPTRRRPGPSPRRRKGGPCRRRRRWPGCPGGASGSAASRGRATRTAGDRKSVV